jgi:hypothetical protein
MKHGFSALAIVACLSPAPATALPQDVRANPLTSIGSLQCRFSLTSSVLWKEGKPDVRTEARESRVSIANIDIQDGTAEVPGPRGRRFATAMLSDGSLFVMESEPGALHVTTVFAIESSPGKLKAVRAEYSYVFLTVPPFVPDPAVSHSYGECEPAAAASDPDQR